MLTDNEFGVTDAWGHDLDSDPRCDDCGRSIVTRFAGLPPQFCDSCQADFALLNRAGKIVLVSAA